MSPIFKTTLFLLSTATALVPLSLAADSFKARSIIEAATLYPQGAEVIRRATLSLPAGTHELVFFDIPVAYEHAQPQGLQASVTGANLGPITMVSKAPNQADRLPTPEAVAAQSVVDALRERLNEAERNAQSIALEGTAASDALEFINGLAAPENASADDIIAFAGAIRTQSLEARLAIQDVEVRTKTAWASMEGLRNEWAHASEKLEKLSSSSDYLTEVTLEVSLENAGEVEVEFTYREQNAGWLPEYLAHVDTVDERLRLERAMAARQMTGEPWIDVALSFATEQPDPRSAPSPVNERLRRITDLEATVQAVRKVGEPTWPNGAGLALSDSAVAEVSVAAAPMREVANFDSNARSYGLNLTFDYASPATLYSSGSRTTDFKLDAIELTPELFVRAVPLYDETGYLVADLVNDSDEVILPGPVQLFRDGTLIGESHLQTQAAGADFELAFGAVEGVRVERVVLDRNEGDRGLISKSNESTSTARLEVENLTSRSWKIELLDRVSVSEQEDLVIEWTAEPMPDEEGVDDKRGVLAWRFDLNANEARSVILEESLRWPENHLLR